MKKKLKNNFKDKRGKIVDIFIKSPKDHCTLVTFNKNAIRKKAFRSKEVKDPNNYIMYMCSNSNYDWFKAKLTKRSYKVERN